MAAIVKYPIGIQTFKKIRQKGYIYVDKTDLVFQSGGTFSYATRCLEEWKIA